MTHDRGTGKNKKPCQKEKATDEELKSPETPRKLLEIRKGTRKTLESDVKNKPKRKDSFSVKLKESLKNSLYGQIQQEEGNKNEPPKVQETLKENHPREGLRNTGTQKQEETLVLFRNN